MNPTDQDLLAERRYNVQEKRRETDKIAQSLLQCHIDEIDRELARRRLIRARLELAVQGNDIAMIYRCRSALSGDTAAARAMADAMEIERMMGGAR